jgi:hypothetical protein
MSEDQVAVLRRILDPISIGLTLTTRKHGVVYPQRVVLVSVLKHL